MRIRLLTTLLLASSVAAVSACRSGGGETTDEGAATQAAEEGSAAESDEPATEAEPEPEPEPAPAWPSAEPEPLSVIPCTISGIELDYEGAFDPIRDMAVQNGYLVLLRDDGKVFRLSPGITPTSCTLTWDPTWGTDNDGFTEFEQRPQHMDAAGGRVWIGSWGGNHVLGAAGTETYPCEGTVTAYLSPDGNGGISVPRGTELAQLTLGDEGCTTAPMETIADAASIREIEVLPEGLGHIAWIGVGENGAEQVVVRRDAEGNELWRYGSAEDGEDSTNQLYGIEVGDRGVYLFFYNTREVRTLNADGEPVGSINIEEALADLGSAIAPADVEFRADGTGFVRIKYYDGTDWVTSVALVRGM